MKKITKDEAIQLIDKRIFPKCEVSRGVFRPIRSISELQALEHLKDVQGFTLWGYEESELADFKAPKGGLKVTVDEATDFILSDSPTVYVKAIGEENVKGFSNTNQLRNYIEYCRQLDFRGVPFVVYWIDEYKNK